MECSLVQDFYIFNDKSKKVEPQQTLSEIIETNFQKLIVSLPRLVREAIVDEEKLLSLKILHGKGDGILRKFIRDYLRKYSHISHFEDEHADRGGDGITYAYIQ